MEESSGASRCQDRTDDGPLHDKFAYLERLLPLRDGDVILDIGANDATTLKTYQTKGLRRIGIDPTGAKFQQYYTDDIALVPDFFSADAYHSVEKRPARRERSAAFCHESRGDQSLAERVGNRGIFLPRFHAVVLSHIEASQSGVAAVALGAGLPIIATPVGGIVEQIKDETTGVLANRIDATSLADAAKRLLLDPQLYQAICQNIADQKGDRSVPRFVEELVRHAVHG